MLAKLQRMGITTCRQIGICCVANSQDFVDKEGHNVIANMLKTLRLSTSIVVNQAAKHMFKAPELESKVRHNEDRDFLDDNDDDDGDDNLEFELVLQ